MALGRAEDPPGLAPFLVAHEAAAQVRSLADIEGLQEEAEAAAHENIDAARIVGDAALGERTPERVGPAGFARPAMSAEEHHGKRPVAPAIAADFSAASVNGA